VTAFARRGFVASAGALALGGCMPRTGGLAALPRLAPLAPIRFDPRQLMRTTVCLRPFRPAGPRVEAERFGEKTVVHNYGHGGSGWSLSWGCADVVAGIVQGSAAARVAVVGAGVIGLTTALRLLESGLGVTIYAHEFTMETRSARATGVWSPSSRVALADAVDSGFVSRWEGWARASHPVHQKMIGLAGDPVEYLTQYNLGGGVNANTPATHDFLHLDRRLRGLNPPWGDMAAEDSPFPGFEGSSGPVLVFNVASYADRLMQMFLLRGGTLVRRQFPDRAAVLALPEPVIVNCMGYGAKAIWSDDSLVPVRGQIGWLMPQPEARYALYYDGVNAISRRDGVVVQYLGENEDWGYGNADETIDPEETARALATMSRVYRT
jgi:D-amino-acid oxidase